MGLEGNFDNLPEKSIVCFRYRGDPHWVLISRLTPEIKREYAYTHSEPSSLRKLNTEQVFPEAVHEYVPLDQQNAPFLKRLYNQSEDRKPLKTKIFTYNFFCVLSED